MTAHDFVAVVAALLGLGGSLVGWLVSRNVGSLDSTLRDTTSQLRAAEGRLHAVELAQVKHEANLTGTREWLERVEDGMGRIERKLDRLINAQAADATIPPRLPSRERV